MKSSLHPIVWMTAVVWLMSTFASAATPSATMYRYPYPQLNTALVGDFNGDGITDMTSGALMMLGKGDGTFTTAFSTGGGGEPLAVGDFNRDGKLDLVVSRNVGTTSEGVYILPGKGDGTFASAVLVANVITPFALAADFNADGRLDLVVNGQTVQGNASVEILPGNGDFTFAPPISLLGVGPWSAISGDFNGDGRRDLAITEDPCCSVYVFLNHGGFLFTTSQIQMSADLGDITTGDLNRDGRLDLVVTEWHPADNYNYAPPVAVLLGNGDGTFGAKTEYPTGVAGSYTVVVGDFTRDGILDVATGNRSVHYDDDFGIQMWDSITVLKGNGSGGLGSPTTFALGSTSYTNAAYVNTQHQLQTSDLNGDHQTDIISSPGVVLLNAPAQVNRAPSAFAGPDRTLSSDTPIILSGEGTDPDGHWLTYTWYDPNGHPMYEHAPRVTPSGLVTGLLPGTYTYTLVVNDGQGGTASDTVTIYVSSDAFGVELRNPTAGETVPVDVAYDITWFAVDTSTRFDVSYSIDNGRTFSAITECTALPGTARDCVWQHPGPASTTAVIRIVDTYGGGKQWSAISPTFSLVIGPRTSLPPNWGHRDVGAVAAAGNATFDGTTWAVTGSGADIWGTADEFHYAYTLATGDVTIIARVASVQNINQWTKAGLMIRSTAADASAPHVSLFATPTSVKGVAFQRRYTEGGTTVHTAGPAIGPPVWLQLSRVGNVFSAYYKTSATGRWTLIARDTVNLPTNVVIGLAVTSHYDGRLATATFDNVSVVQLPAWQQTDVGSVGHAGNASGDGVNYTVSGSGADIWGTADAFHYMYTSVGSDVTMTARVTSLTNTNPWSKAGVMMRESLAPGARHVMVIVSPGKGVAMQYRGTTGGTSANVALHSGAAPTWVRLKRSGNTFTGYMSADGVTWTTLGSISLSLPYGYYVGLPVTAHDNTAVATATFEDVKIDPFY